MQVFSGYIKSGEGFNAPVPFDGPPGWTVFKQSQTGVIVVTHNLNLTNPWKQLHITIAQVDPPGFGHWPDSMVYINENSANHFRVMCNSTKLYMDTTGQMVYGGEVQTGLMFIAAYYPKKRFASPDVV